MCNFFQLHKSWLHRIRIVFILSYTKLVMYVIVVIRNEFECTDTDYYGQVKFSNIIIIIIIIFTR